MVHSTVLIDLGTEESRRLQYWPPPEGFNGPVDDIVQFAFSAKKEGKSIDIIDYVYVVYNIYGKSEARSACVGV